MTEKIKEQILTIRKIGITNMFDTKTVQALANEMELYELVGWIEKHRKEYVRFILTGEED